MLTVKEVYEAIDAFAPFASQESWDNSGLLVGGMAQPADRILTTLDISEAIVAQAVAEQVQLVVAHHPVIFSPLKTLPPDSPVYQLAAHGIAAICVHTPLDMAPLGLNTFAHTLLEKPLVLQGTQEVLEPSWTDGRGFGWIDHQCPHMDTANAGTDAANGIRGSAVLRRRAFHSENCLLFRLGCVHAGTGCGKGL